MGTTECGLCPLGHAPYLPDVAPSDFHLFPNLKQFVSGKRFASSEEVEAAVDGYSHSPPDSPFRRGILMLEKRRTKCVGVKGDYVEIKNHFNCKSRSFIARPFH
jgi:hypothetical protein